MRGGCVAHELCRTRCIATVSDVECIRGPPCYYNGDQKTCVLSQKSHRMTILSNLLTKAKKAAYLEWIGFARTVLGSLIIIAVTISFFASTDAIQSTEYGVLGLACALLFSVWISYRAFDKYEDIRPLDYSTERFTRLRKSALLAAVGIPIANSWSMNESLYGAINPPGYWRDELANSTPGNCSELQDIVARNAEELRVTQNKFRMGIATAFELKGSAEGLKLISEVHRDCLVSAESRRAKASKRLNQLKGNK